MNSGKRRWSEKDFNIARIQALPNNSCTFQQFTDIQETMLLILHCKTIYSYRKDLPSYNNHVGNANELNSKVRNALIPGGTSLKRGRQAVIFTTVNTMEDVYGMGENTMEIFRNQGSRHTRVLGNAFNRQYFGAI